MTFIGFNNVVILFRCSLLGDSTKTDRKIEKFEGERAGWGQQKEKERAKGNW